MLALLEAMPVLRQVPDATSYIFALSASALQVSEAPVMIERLTDVALKACG